MPSPRAVRPILPVADLAEAAGFYRSLGFVVQPHDSGYAWVLREGAEWFHLRVAPGLDTTANPAAIYLHVADADAWHAEWQGCAAELGEVADRPWGMREFSLRDPSGNLIRVGHNL